MAEQKFHFADRLIDAIKAKGTAICVGLDPRLDQIPDFIKQDKIAKRGRTFEAAADSLIAFNKGIINVIHDLVPIVKLQIAFYEEHGFPGIFAFEETIKYAKKKGLLVIADCKRNDISSTAEAYARAYLGKVNLFGEEVESFNTDALTVNAYLGYDGIEPFIDECKKNGKGIFILVKTSNKSSCDLQDRELTDNMRNYELMAHFVESWGVDNMGTYGYSCIGAVVGATFPKEAKILRRIMPHCFFLVPGYGAQGASAKDVLACFNEDGLGAIVNSSRDIIFAWQKSKLYSEHQYEASARDAVLKMKKELESATLE